MTEAGVPEVPGVGSLEPLPRTGPADAFRGTDAATGQAVVVKVLPAPFDRYEQLHFEREHGRIARLGADPLIRPVERFGVLADGRPYLVSEWCPESLSERLRRGGPLDASVVAALGRQLAATLYRLHCVGVVHGAVTPENVLCRESDAFVLADIGLAARVGYPAGEGRELFAAPETMRTGTVSVAGDLYGLGATLYAALCGHPPFPPRFGEQPGERVLRVLAGPAPPLAPGTCDPMLAELLADLLATEPAARPADAADVAARLASLAAAPAEATPAEPVPTAVSTDPDADSLDGSADWSGLLDEVRSRDGAAVTGVSPPTPPPAAPPERRRRRPRIRNRVRPARPRRGQRTAGPSRLGAVLGGAALALLVLALALQLTAGPSGQPQGKHPSRTSAKRPAASPAPTTSSPQIRLLSVHDTGRTVRLAWTGDPEIEYAVISAQLGARASAVLVGHSRTATLAVAPRLAYCFVVQATDGTTVIESAPRAIRGAICHE